VLAKQYERVICWRLRHQRLELGLTQEEAADKAGMSLKRYQHLELGIRFNPTLKTLLKLCQTLGLELADLLKKPTPQELELSKRKSNRRAPKRA
jgi:transcriptional regulator with XRE-family HTH domain